MMTKMEIQMSILMIHVAALPVHVKERKVKKLLGTCIAITIAFAFNLKSCLSMFKFLLKK